MKAIFRMHWVLAAAGTMLATACGSKVTVMDDGTGASGANGQGGANSSTTGTGNGPSVGGSGGNPSECPLEEPGPSDSCEAPLSCTYGEECCCGDCFSSIECSCFNGTFDCFFTDACYAPSCEACEHSECPVDCGPGNDCGDLNSNFDDFGCLRQSCSVDANCDAGEKCYTPFDFGGCTPSGIDCFVDKDGFCGCGSTADCGGSYCVPERMYPPPPPG